MSAQMGGWEERDWALSMVREKKLTASDFLVLVVLLKYRNSQTGKCFPSQETVARVTNLSLPTVKRATARLREKEVIYVAKRPKRKMKGFSGNEYTFSIGTVEKGDPIKLLGGKAAVKESRQDFDGIKMYPLTLSKNSSTTSKTKKSPIRKLEKSRVSDEKMIPSQSMPERLPRVAVREVLTFLDGPRHFCPTANQLVRHLRKLRLSTEAAQQLLDGMVENGTLRSRKGRYLLNL